MSGARDSRRPVAVFDSGVGGLTVLAALRRRLPAEDYLYLGDTARVPYGIKSPETVRRYAAEIVGFLRKFRPKMFVVACNTVSSTAMPALRPLVKGAPGGILGVIEPGAEAALAATRGGRVGVIGTTATVASGAYPSALRRMARGTGKRLRITARACPLFVPLAEEGWTDGAKSGVPALAARRYLAPLRRAGTDTLILGCTHYPLLRKTIAREMGPRVALIDSAEATALAAKERLRRLGLLAPTGGRGTLRCFVTDDGARFGALARRFLRHPVKGVRRVRLGAD